MRHKHLTPVAVLSTGLVLFTACSAAFAQSAPGDKPSSTAPLMALLDRFTASDVPAMGPAEIAVPPRKAVTNAPPTDLPGNGLAQHPMLYIGEGCNKMYLVNGGKVIWTYSTGPGNEYDDVWMLSNGNILFTRMQYLAEITPKKEVVWRLDAPKGTEIHCCQPIGTDKVLFVENGLPPKLIVMNIKTGEAVEVRAWSLPRRGSAWPTPRPSTRNTAAFAALLQGTYLASCLGLGAAGKVVEYDKDFKEIWSYDIKSPWAAIRLKNGNTLITDENDKLTREVNPKKETVWELKPRPTFPKASGSSTPRLAPAWPTATPSSAPAAATARAPSSLKSPPTKKSPGSCGTLKTSAPPPPSRFSTTPASPKTPANPSTDI